MIPDFADMFSKITGHDSGWNEGQVATITASLLENLPAFLSFAGQCCWTNGNTPFTCGIINARSGRCAEDCSFCAQSRFYPTGVSEHPLISVSRLLERAEALAQAGVNYMGIVTSGTGPGKKDFETICQAAHTIGEQVGIKLCASLGLITVDQARMLKQAGFSSYHHNLETSFEYYPSICTTHAYERRTETVQAAKEAGLRICSGGIFGLGEEWRHRFQLSRTLDRLEVDSIPINFLSPIPGTPLQNRPLLQPAEALAIVAAFRLMHPERDIVICGGRTATLGNWDNTLLLAGANGLMVGDYLTTKGSAFERDREMLRTLGVLS